MARSEPPFSNGDEWELWQYNTCQGAGRGERMCIHDVDEDCPLIALALIGRTPAEWVGPRGRYTCGEKKTRAQARREAAAAQNAADQAALEALHHGPLFQIDEPPMAGHAPARASAESGDNAASTRLAPSSPASP